MDIIIDERIRNWVFIPLVVVIFMVFFILVKYFKASDNSSLFFIFCKKVGILRFYITQYFNNKKVRD